MGLIEKPSDPHGLTLEAWAQVSSNWKYEKENSADQFRDSCLAVS